MFKEGLRLQSLILLLLIPSLAIVTSVYAWFVYESVYRSILDGFDKKLYAASSTSASFIDGTIHNQIFDPRLIKGITFSKRSGESVLLALDVNTGDLLTIAASTGEAVRVQRIDLDLARVAALNDLSYIAKENIVLAVLADSNVLIEFNPDTGKILKQQQLSLKGEKLDPLTGIEYVEKSDAVYLSNSNLYRLNRSNGAVVFIEKLSENNVSSLATDKNPDRLIGVESSSGKLISVDYQSGRSFELGKISASDNVVEDVSADSSNTAWSEKEEIVLPVFGLTRVDDERLLATTDRLISWSFSSGKASAADSRKGFRNDTSPDYLSFVIPMRRILKSLGLTYHYTAIPLKNNTMAYVLDATEGEEHSLSGTEEENTDLETARLRKVMRDGEVSLSQIEQFDKWGLLKVGTAPIFNSQGQVKALAGADVNISVIDSKTRKALLMVLAVGVVALLLAVAASVLIAKRLIVPITQLKEAALSVAAGNFKEISGVTQPGELKELSDAFSEANALLQESELELKKKNGEFENTRRQQELTRLLRTGAGLFRPVSVMDKNAKQPRINVLGIKNRKSDILEHGKWTVIWVATQGDNTLRSEKLSADLKVIACLLLNQYATEPALLLENLTRYLGVHVEVLLLGNSESAVLTAISCSSAHRMEIWSDRETTKMALVNKTTLPWVSEAPLSIGIEYSGQSAGVA